MMIVASQIQSCGALLGQGGSISRSRERLSITMISQNRGLSVLALTVSIQPLLTQEVALSKPRAWCLMTLQCRAESTGSSLSERSSWTLMAPLLVWEPIHGQPHSILTTCSLNVRLAKCTRVSFAIAQSRFAALPGSMHHRGL